MFIRHTQHPDIEFDPSAGQQEPNLVHHFSDRAGPFKTALPVLIAGAGQDEEQVLVVASPLSELLDTTIWLHRETEFKDRVVVDEVHRPFFEAVKASLVAVIAKLEQIEFAVLDHDEEHG